MTSDSIWRLVLVIISAGVIVALVRSAILRFKRARPINEIARAVAHLRVIAEHAGDADLRFFASRLNEEIKIILQFRSGRMYTEAKYTADFVKMHAQEFASDTRIDGETSMALGTVVKFADEVLTLPDTTRTVDRSAAISQREDRLRTPPGPYSERYLVGSPVKIAPIEELEEFMRTYKYHHALVPEQLRYAGMVTTVRAVGYYHGGDIVYTLDGTEKFAWLEPCLRDPHAAPDQQ